MGGGNDTEEEGHAGGGIGDIKDINLSDTDDKLRQSALEKHPSPISGTPNKGLSSNVCARSASEKSTFNNEELNEKEAIEAFQRKIFYTLLFAFVTTCRASLNVASAKFTCPYNISE